jgi:DNA-binding Xre family transcriptional regulator
MLKVNLQRFFAGRAIAKPYTYLVKQGFSKNIATRLNNGKLQRVDLGDIERLCVLFQCTPNDLLEWTPAASQTDAETQPLRDLIRVNPNVNVLAVLNSLPYSKLAEVEKLISEKAQKNEK